MSSRLQKPSTLHRPNNFTHQLAVPERHFHELRTGFDKITAVISNDIKTWAATCSARVFPISPKKGWIHGWMQGICFPTYLPYNINHPNIGKYTIIHGSKKGYSTRTRSGWCIFTYMEKNLSYHQFW